MASFTDEKSRKTRLRCQAGRLLPPAAADAGGLAGTAADSTAGDGGGGKEEVGGIMAKRGRSGHARTGNVIRRCPVRASSNSGRSIVGRYAATVLFGFRTAAFAFHHPPLDPAWTGRVLASELLAGVDDFPPVGAAALLDLIEQAFAGDLAVGGLGTRILNRDRCSGGAMAQRHGGRDLVDVLPARPARAGEGFREIRRVQLEACEPGEKRVHAGGGLRVVGGSEVPAAGRGLCERTTTRNSAPGYRNTGCASQ